jgi:hypothetical protein
MPSLLALLVLSAGCAGRAAAPTPGPAAAASPSAADGSFIPFALCRPFGVSGTPCYPTNADIGAHRVGPCRDRHHGTCEVNGQCQLVPTNENKPCGDGVVCKDGRCVPP